jgi:hypothetical protein
MPHKPEFKDRWVCHGCGMRGDEADIMKEVMPGEDWPRRRTRLAQWRKEWEREVGAGDISTPRTGSQPCPKCGQPGMAGAHEIGVHSVEANRALKDIEDVREFDPLRFAQHVLSICASHGLDPCRLSTRIASEIEGRRAWSDARRRAATPQTAQEVIDRWRQDERRRAELRDAEELIRENLEFEADPMNPKFRHVSAASLRAAARVAVHN